MLALIAGRGDLPKAVANAQSTPPLICSVRGFAPNGLDVDQSFRIEKLGGFLRYLKAQGVSEVCMCGGIDRPALQLSQLDIWTLPLIPTLLKALKLGDDGALRAVIQIFESRGIAVKAAHQLVPALLPASGVLSSIQPDAQASLDAKAGDAASVQMGQVDLGQACLIRDGHIIVQEIETGTDAMLGSVADQAKGAVFYKAPKPDQDRRVDLPTIGPETAQRAADLGLRGLVIEAGGVIVLDQAKVVDILDRTGLFLWVRERGAS